MKQRRWKEGDKVMVLGQESWGVCTIMSLGDDGRRAEVGVYDESCEDPFMEVWVRADALMDPEEFKLLHAISPEKGL